MNHILMVDDDSRIRAVVKKYFTTFGFMVEEVENGELAVALIKSVPQKFSIVIMDMMMPKMNGLEAFEEIRSLQIEVPVIMATAHGNLTLGVEFMKRGGADFIEKPLSLEILALKVNQVLEKKRLREEMLSERILKQAILESSKLRREFLDKITHEFRTPIHAVLNFSKFGLASTSAEKNATYFQNINDSGKKLLALIDNLLSFSKQDSDISSFDFKRENITEVFQQALTEYQEIRKDDKSEFCLIQMKDPVYTHFDAKRIKQTFFRVFDNLFKFETEVKKIFVVMQLTSQEVKKIDGELVSLPALRLYLAKFSSPHSQDNILTEIEIFAKQNRQLSVAMTDDFDLLLFENIIKAHRGVFNRLYVPNQGILFEISLPISS